jgi:putative tricarboxylic transport membrane protein
MKQESKLAGVVAGLLLGLLAVLIAWSTSQLKIAPNYAKVGPQVFTYFAAAALAIVGTCFIVQSLRNSPDKVVGDTDETDWKALAFILLGFVFEIVFIKILGFILASTVLFTAVAFGFGSRKIVRDVIIALIVSSLAYFTFTKLLNLQLPAGILQGFI